MSSASLVLEPGCTALIPAVQPSYSYNTMHIHLTNQPIREGGMLELLPISWIAGSSALFSLALKYILAMPFAEMTHNKRPIDAS